jgi:hypothetical protein
MVRKATGWVTGTRERKGTSSPGGSTIGSGGGAGPKSGTSESFHPIGGGIDGRPAEVPAAGAFPESATGEPEAEVAGAKVDGTGAGEAGDEGAAAARWLAGDRIALHPATGNNTSTAHSTPSSTRRRVTSITPEPYGIGATRPPDQLASRKISACT